MRYGRRTLVMLATGAAVLLAAGAATASGTGGDWTQADHDASGNRANTTATQITAANAATVGWVRGFVASPYRPTEEFGCGEGWTAPVVVAKKAYAVKSGVLAALDLVTGAQRWQQAVVTDWPSEFWVAAVAGGRVYVGQLDCVSQSDPNGTIRVFDANTGAPLWTAPVTGLEGIAVTATRVLGTGSTTASGTSVRVFAPATGALVWEHYDSADCVAAPRIVFDQVYYQECDPETGLVTDLAAARVADGTVVWRKAGRWAVERGDWPSTGSTHVFTNGVALNPTSGATRYTLVGVTRVDAVDTQRVYGACGTVVCAFSKSTGARVWTSTIEDSGVSAAVAGALLYLPTGQVLNSATGAVVTSLWSGTASWLSVGNGYVLAVPATSPRLLDVYGLPGS